ncbi:hypothetical protein B0I75DRAFT_136287 [Yarrowia lipolytica]|nr:hypothetical protein B0I74DRAFT_137413 [Yarrowia lipolytica]RDW53527.1 hypothetical protein B0I75DRAFT_136287 [Yarrowia lipolytica]
MASSENAVVDVGVTLAGRTIVVLSRGLGKIAVASLPHEPVHVVGVLLLLGGDLGVEGDLDGDIILGDVAKEHGEPVGLEVLELNVLGHIGDLLVGGVVPSGGQTVVEVKSHILEKSIGGGVGRAGISKLINNLHSVVGRSRNLDGPFDSVTDSLGVLVSSTGVDSSLDLDLIRELLASGRRSDGDGTGALDILAVESGLHEELTSNLVVLGSNKIGVGSGKVMAFISDSHDIVAIGILDHEVVVSSVKRHVVIDIKREVITRLHVVGLRRQGKLVVQLPSATGVSLLVGYVVSLSNLEGCDGRSDLLGERQSG